MYKERIYIIVSIVCLALAIINYYIEHYSWSLFMLAFSMVTMYFALREVENGKKETKEEKLSSDEHNGKRS